MNYKKYQRNNELSVHSFDNIVSFIFVILSLLFFLSITNLRAQEVEKYNKSVLRVAAFSSDVPAIDTFSPAFDPDSYVVITQIFDTLVYQDLDGEFTPSLATSWEQLSPTKWVFNLRKGVYFHNGEPFNAKAVKFTYELSIDPKIKAGTQYILGSFDRVELDPKDLYRVYIHTKWPDGMFLHRFTMYGSIAPPQYIKKVGLKGFAAHPIGTGPYRFKQWKKGEYIELAKNDNYWDKSIPNIDIIRFLIIPEKDWIDEFLKGNIDYISHLPGNKRKKVIKKIENVGNIIRRQTLLSYWVHIRNKGALANVNVRKALNHAVDKKALVGFADLGNAIPLASMGKKGEFGANPVLKPYEFDRKKAKKMLEESGVLPLKLTAIVADVAQPIAIVIRQNFKKVGVDLTLTIMPRGELAKLVTGQKITTGIPVDYDLIIWMADNPIFNMAFHAGVFLHSGGPWSNLVSPKFDELYDSAIKSDDSETHKSRLQTLDAYIHEQALMIFTTQRIMAAASTLKLHIPKFSMSGHLNYITLSTAQFKQ